MTESCLIMQCIYWDGQVHKTDQQYTMGLKLRL